MMTTSTILPRPPPATALPARLRVRPLTPKDRVALADCFARLSPASRRLRFFGAKQQLSDAELRLFTSPDGREHVGLAAVALDARGNEGRILGAARCLRLAPGADTAELAIAVADDAQRLGLGRRLLAELIEAARAAGIRRLVVEVLPDNQGMRSLAEGVGAVAEPGGDLEAGARRLLIPVDPATATVDPWGWLDTAALLDAIGASWLRLSDEALRTSEEVIEALWELGPFSLPPPRPPPPRRGANQAR